MQLYNIVQILKNSFTVTDNHLFKFYFIFSLFVLVELILFYYKTSLDIFKQTSKRDHTILGITSIFHFGL